MCLGYTQYSNNVSSISLFHSENKTSMCLGYKQQQQHCLLYQSVSLFLKT